MLRSLDPDELLALVDDNKRAGSLWRHATKIFFRDRNLSHYALNLLMAFANELSTPVLTTHSYMCKDEKQGVDEWSIAFRV